MSALLQGLIPSSNRLEAAFARVRHNGRATPAGPSAKTQLLEAAYDSGFVGAFKDHEDQPTWARRAARYLEDEFFADTPGRKKLFSDIASQLAPGDGERHVNCRHALELWEAGGRKGPMPYSCEQDYGSCVDASTAEHETTMFGWRAAQPGLREQFLHSAAWLKYANRGYCSDGWSGSGIATVARRVGCAFRTKYDLPGGSVDFTDDDKNEQIVARTWCRSGIPQWLVDHTSKNHGYEDGAITRFDGDHRAMLAILKAGGVLHAGGVRTSGGPRPFAKGSTGPHMQSTVGGDDTEECRRWFADQGITWAADDFPIINHQTWGPGWRGECADAYWPTHLWGPKPQGAWVTSAKWWMSDVEYAWLPLAKGFPAAGPPPAPVIPTLGGELYAEQAGQIIAIRGEVIMPANPLPHAAYVLVPSGNGRFRFVPKPVI